MNVHYSRQFIKNYKKRVSNNPKLKKQFSERVKLFINDPNNPLLRDHNLVGAMTEYRSFSITGDIRLIYSDENDGSILLIDVGTHAQVYG